MTTRGYNAVEAQIDLPAMEHEILRFWEQHQTFEKSLEATADGAAWTFYEGPPTANGMPGTHHIEARVFKDVFPRFKTMQGFHVDRKAGWDCHGLPVELAVEKELGFSGKADIEAYGIEAFNARCRESVLRHVDAFAELTDRMGYWVNMDEAYVTMTPEYVQSVWWALKQIFDAELLQEDYRVAPYCPRCGTTLSDHELAQGYEDVVDPSVYVRFPLTSGPLAGQVDLLVWTTTPWTLVSNTAVAAHPEVTYVVGSHPEHGSVLVAEPLFGAVLGEEWTRGQSLTGAELERWNYQRPFELVDFPETEGGTHYIVLADYVTTEDGTGLVHQSPAFGADDMAVCRAYGLPMVNPVRPDGTFEEHLALVGGQFFKTADEALMRDLSERGLMFRQLAFQHSYPHCWRCHTPLLYYAQPSWYIRTTRISDRLLEENDKTNWHPENVKYGRYGNWLNNNIDWALSRSRYWGTPLPIWRNVEESSDVICVGSLAELGELAGRDLEDLDPHRPFIDDVVIERDGKTYHRVPEVIDAWFDSGSMPFAQWGYPWVEGSRERFETAYPADFISEAIDQTRGWFYSLMAVGTLVFDQSSYRNVVCLGHILAEDGRKMSKHLGNVLAPIPLMERHGADAVRWFMACAGSPWAARRVGDNTIAETVRKVLLTYWNTVAFQSLYAGAAGWAPSGDAVPHAERHVLDRWLASGTQVLVREVTAALENFDTQRAGSLLATFVDDLSNWYVRRSRRRFWKGDASALWTLHETLETVTRLMAPIMPFVSEKVWQELFVPADPSAPASVHLASWPVADETLVDEDLGAAFSTVRRLVDLGRSARVESRMKIRQVLRRMLVPQTLLERLSPELVDEIREELNIVSVESFSSAGDLVDHSAKGNFRNLGKRFGKQTPLVAAAIAQADAADLAARLPQGPVPLEVPEVGLVEVGADDVLLTERPRQGWSVVNEQGETVALDLELDDELLRAGLAREVVRAVQEARKNAGLEVTDRIQLRFRARPDVAEAIREHRGSISDEVLAVAITDIEEAADAGDDELGLEVHVTRAQDS